MRKLLISFLSSLLISVNLLYSQSIDESIAYLNKISYEHYGYFFWYTGIGGDVGSSANGDGILVSDRSYHKSYYVFSIDSVGLLTVKYTYDKYVIPTSTPLSPYLDKSDELKVFKEKGIVTSSASLYIKKISDSIPIIESKIDYPSGTSYYVSVFCAGDDKCINTVGSDTPSRYFEFEISGAEYASRFKNAFFHLITIAKQNPNYWDKDPFE